MSGVSDVSPESLSRVWAQRMERLRINGERWRAEELAQCLSELGAARAVWSETETLRLEMAHEDGVAEGVRRAGSLLERLSREIPHPATRTALAAAGSILATYVGSEPPYQEALEIMEKLSPPAVNQAQPEPPGWIPPQLFLTLYGQTADGRMARVDGWRENGLRELRLAVVQEDGTESHRWTPIHRIKVGAGASWSEMAI